MVKGKFHQKEKGTALIASTQRDILLTTNRGSYREQEWRNQLPQQKQRMLGHQITEANLLTGNSQVSQLIH